MSVPASKPQLIEAITSSFGKLLSALDEVPPELVEECSLEGHAKGTRMSVANLVAYLVGWNELVLTWLERDASGQPIDFPDTGFKWNELGRLAQRFYQDYEAVPYPELLERFQAANRSLLAAVASRDDAELYGRAWYRQWTMGRMIQFNSASPYANARARLRRWLKQT